eukprot:833007_1
MDGAISLCYYDMINPSGFCVKEKKNILKIMTLTKAAPLMAIVCSLLFITLANPIIVPGAKMLNTTTMTSNACDTKSEWFSCSGNYGYYYQDKDYYHCCGSVRRYCPIEHTECAPGFQFPATTTIWTGCCPDTYGIACNNDIDSVWCCPKTHPYCTVQKGCSQNKIDSNGMLGLDNQVANSTSCNSQ